MFKKIQRSLNGGVAEPPTRQDAASLPACVRAAKPGKTEHYPGLTRGKLYALEAAGLIKTASLVQPGTMRGVKLFSLQSLLDYVESCSKSGHRAREVTDSNKRIRNNSKLTRVTNSELKQRIDAVASRNAAPGSRLANIAAPPVGCDLPAAELARRAILRKAL